MTPLKAPLNAVSASSDISNIGVGAALEVPLSMTSATAVMYVRRIGGNK